MDRSLISSASKKLELIRIALDRTSLTRNPDLDPLMYPQSMLQQNMFGISTQQITIETDKDSVDIFRVYVSLGSRALEKEEENEEDINVFYRLEATYRLEYKMKGKLTEEELGQFSEFNAIHNTWPFWRELVFSTLRQAELPVFSIPLMHGKNLDKTSTKIIQK